MKCPFPGMDPWLEHPALWPDVHDSFLAAIRDEITPFVVPRYYVALGRRTYLLQPDDLIFVGRPDVGVVSQSSPPAERTPPREAVGVIDVEVAVSDEVTENYLEVHDVETGALVTALELLSPANKLHPKHREDYERKRQRILDSRTNLIEIDLLRAGRPMPVVGRRPESDYRILVSRGWTRPRAKLHALGLRQPIPPIPVPLGPEEKEPELRLGDVLHALYERARFDLRIRYDLPPDPPLGEEDSAWARGLLDKAP
ncbi:MAG: DUF4058 family protein [Planctomycetes bacterium]|nr:DUF4058 family protein [Planctomycetota bacterium]